MVSQIETFIIAQDMRDPLFQAPRRNFEIGGGGGGGGGTNTDSVLGGGGAQNTFSY